MWKKFYEKKKEKKKKQFARIFWSIITSPDAKSGGWKRKSKYEISTQGDCTEHKDW